VEWLADNDLLMRYSRQILLPQLDVEGQDKLLNARVLVIGMGGLGTPVAMYLAGAGIGELIIADYDQVELSNLHRQVVHSTADIGRDKVESARDRMLAINPQIKVTPISSGLDADSLQQWVGRASSAFMTPETKRVPATAACSAMKSAKKRPAARPACSAR